MKTDEIRERFLSFFEERGHQRLPSDSLVPSADPTLLYSGAGMNQFKAEFQGEGRVRDGLRRACTSQKCFRADDLDQVGHTVCHHTFFEMLGNFSFGDYFKREATEWAWELLLDGYGFDPDRLLVTIYEDDEEAASIWRDVIRVPQDRIHRFGEHDNYWPADAPSSAPPGTLCGPCTEIFYDYGPGTGCGRPDCGPSCDCDRYVEIWNLVFQQFRKQDDGTLEPLPTKNIDTGMGLERLAAVLQGVRSDYDIDVFVPIVRQISDITGRRPEPGTPDKVRIHRIADHIRGAVFCIGDGVLPGNKGRGYVLRRILRRACRDGHEMGIEEPFLHTLVPAVVEAMKQPYPELVARRENLARIVKAEEHSFLATLSRGSAILAERLEQLKRQGATELPADAAAELWDTYGFPFEMTQELCAEQGLAADRAAFDAAMGQRQSGEGAHQAGQVFDTSALAQVKAVARPTDFRDADVIRKARVEAIVVGDQIVDEATEGDEVTILLDWTRFYAQSGGQVGDTGDLKSAQAHVQVVDTTRDGDYFHHHGRVVSGTLRKGDEVEVLIDTQRRTHIARNHTATHLLHWALRTALGEHVEQAGSLVAPDRLRFDFTHFAPLTQEEVSRVEELVNERILENTQVAAKLTTLEQAKAEGAMALFGELYKKHGDEVRMISVGDFSKELCGGTHVGRTGEIGLFQIVSETGIAAGVRRIEALTGHAAYTDIARQRELLARLGEVLKAPRQRLAERAIELVAETKELARELDKAKRQSFTDILPPPSAEGRGGEAPAAIAVKAQIGDTVIIAGSLAGAKPNDLRLAADQLRRTHPSAAILVGTASDTSANLLCALTKDLVARGLSAGDVVKAIAGHIGGGGGGRPDLAQAGGKKPGGLPAALDAGVQAIQAQLEDVMRDA